MTLRDAGPEAAAAVVTAVAGAAGAAGALGTVATGPNLSGLLPAAVTAVWVWAALTAPGSARLLLAAALALAAAVVVGSPAAALVLAVWVIGGLAAGDALRRGRRLDVVLVLAVLPAVWLTIAAGGAAADQVLDESGRRTTAMFERYLPSAGAPGGQEAALAEARAGAAVALKIMRQLWPALVALSLLGHGIVAVAVGRWLADRRGRGGTPPGWTVPREWRLPFYVVWILVAGLALVAIRVGPAARAGANLIVVAAVLCSVQGLAVMAGLLHRAAPPWLQAVLGLLALLLMAPLLVPAAAMLGLMDQWLDFRRLAAAGGGPDPRP
ncbi:MAG: DUF2232 domain-containing protein [Candidatus Krumholzibacteriia bacterium]